MSLFPIYGLEEDESKKPSNAWLTIGSSYNEPVKKKKDTQPEETKAAQATTEERSGFFNVGQRMTANDLIDLDESDSSEESAKRKKQKKKKKKNKKKKDYNPDFDDLDKIISADEDMDYAISLYQPKASLLTHDTEFLYKYKMKQGLCEVSILSFGEKGLYTYGFPQTKDVPAFRRMRYNVILGLKSDKSTLGLLDELNKVQGINRSMYSNLDTTMPMRRYYNTPAPKDDVIELKRNPNPDPWTLQMDFISLEQAEEESDTEEESMAKEFKLNRDEMSEKEANLLDKTREYNKKLEATPTDPLLWIDFVNFQDKHHQGMVGRGASHSLVEKKLAILEKAMTEKNKLENHPLMVLFYLRLLDQSNKNDDFYKVLHNTWHKYIEKNNTNVVFWILYTDFKYSNFSKFSITYMRESFNESLINIQERISRASNTKEITIFKHLQLYLIKKLCYFEKMAGFTERATGIFQSLAELNIFVPESAQKIHDKNLRMQKYQEYYEKYELPRTGELINHTGWPDCEKDAEAVKAELDKNFIGTFETKALSNVSKVDAFNKFITDAANFIPENFEEGDTKPLLDWIFGELDSMTYWRPANSELDATRVAESPDSIVLFEDIQNYLYTVHQESFKIEILDMLFELLDLPPIFSGVFQRISQTSINWLYSTKLQNDLQEIFAEKLDVSKGEFQISGIETNELYLKYPNPSYILAAVKKYPLYLSRLEYARRFLYHLNNVVPDVDNILGYILYIESLYSQISQVYKTEEITGSEKRIEEMLKKYQKNYYLYIMYTEHAYLKSGKLDRVKKVFDNLLKFATKKKDILMIYYFYINFYVRRDIYRLSKDYQNDVLKLLWKLACQLQGIKHVESDLSATQMIQVHKTITKLMSEAILTPPSGKSKRPKLYSMTKVCPLSKASILVYFWFLASNLCLNQEVESVIKDFRQNMNVLQLKLEEKLKKNIELERLEFIKKNNQNLIDLLNLSAYRVLVYRKHSANYVNPQVLKRFALENTKQSHKNVTLAIETIKAIYATSLRTNQLFKLKTSLDLKMVDTPYWYIIISEELRRYKVEEKEKFVNLVKSYFQEYSKEETLYDQFFSEMEKKYRKTKTTPVWDDYNYFQENHLYINDQFGKLYLKFIQLFFPQNLKREAVILLHRLPFSKDKYLNYMIPCLNDDAEVKKIFTMVLEKEIRMYKEYNISE